MKEDLEPIYSNEPPPGIRPPVPQEVIDELVKLIEEKSRLEEEHLSAPNNK